MKNIPSLIPAAICLMLSLPCHAGKIHDAVAKRDLAALDRALKQEPKQVNAICYAPARRPSLLSDVVLSGHVESVEFLLSDKVDVNFQDQNGFTPLTFALIALQNKRQQAMMNHAVSEDDCARIVELLLEHGAKANQVSAIGLTPVHLAAANGGARIMKALLKAGGNPSPSMNEIAISPLQTAATLGKAETVQLLLDAGADLKAASQEGDTLLHFATIRGNAPVVKLLIAKHLDVNAKNKRHEATPLHYAAGANSTECVELLLNAGASPNMFDSNHANPLTVAVNLKGQLENLESAPTQVADGQRQVVLNLQSRLRIIHLLLQAGAATDMDLKNSATARRTFIQYARDMGTPEIVELLQNPPRVVKKKR
jgi:ankyrin repeat protein